MARTPEKTPAKPDAPKDEGKPEAEAGTTEGASAEKPAPEAKVETPPATSAAVSLPCRVKLGGNLIGPGPVTLKPDQIAVLQDEGILPPAPDDGPVG